MVRRNHIFSMIATAVLCIGLTVSAAAAGDGPVLRIGLKEGQGRATVTSIQPVVVYRNGKQWKKYAAYTAIPVSFTKNGIAVNGSSGIGSVTIKPAQGNGTISLDGHTYRGDIEFVKIPARWGMTIVNEVPLEDYLYGVVGKEMAPGWAAEALKAQSVAARTYAVSHRGYFKSRGFDMTNNTWSQVYGGVAAEAPSVTQAVNATRGEILTSGGKPIDALYSTSAGGWTENSENVWGDYQPYLRGVSDPSDRMPAYRWQVTTTAAALAQKLTGASKGVGKIYSITLTPLMKRPMAVNDRGVSGRVKTITFTGSAGSRTVTGNAFQQIYGLNSTLFDFYQGTVPTNVDGLKKAPRPHVLKLKDNLPLTIAGYGWGHGLGMSQWGANQMAQDNPNKKDFYQTILTHYYSNTRIEKLY